MTEKKEKYFVVNWDKTKAERDRKCFGYEEASSAVVCNTIDEAGKLIDEWLSEYGDEEGFDQFSEDYIEIFVITKKVELKRGNYLVSEKSI